MENYTEENRTMEIAHPTEQSGKHNSKRAVVTFAESSYYCVISLRFVLRT
jgi:hypothetical protein